MNPIGVFGGTFDPIHFGHINPVLDVCRQTGISEVRYIPNSRPGHRGLPKTDASHRWNMTQLALEGYSELIADDREIRRPGTSYMVPTLRSMRSEYPLRPLSLILGIDAFLQIHRWYWWACVLQLANIIVMSRPGFHFPHQLPGWWSRAVQDKPRALFEKMSGSIFHVVVPPIDISASDLRRKLFRRENVAGLLPEIVTRYAEEHHIYTDSGGNT